MLEYTPVDPPSLTNEESTSSTIRRIPELNADFDNITIADILEADEQLAAKYGIDQETHKDTNANLEAVFAARASTSPKYVKKASIDK